MNEKVIQLRPSNYSEKLGNYIKNLKKKMNNLKWYWGTKKEYIIWVSDSSKGEVK